MKCLLKFHWLLLCSTFLFRIFNNWFYLFYLPFLLLFPYTFHATCCLTILFDDTGLKNNTDFSFLQRNRKLSFALRGVCRRNTSMNSKLGLRLSMHLSLLKLEKLGSEALFGVVESSETTWKIKAFHSLTEKKNEFCSWKKKPPLLLLKMSSGEVFCHQIFLFMSDVFPNQ